ncbi:MAG: sigma-54-dependent Fis family transcriptional regulator [Bdellovibrionales bacterium]|nr:sigma-54-dependent Fis family transcriptional regulator [Bdellovibrionales bacterium]
MKQILVVDDEETVRSSLALLLKSQFNVVTAPDGETALNVFTEKAPDLVLLDVMMPKVDGIETLRRLKAKAPGLPVIMLTAANSVRTAVEAMKLGASDYLSKPFDVEDLSSTIIKTLEEQAAEKVVPSAKLPSSKRALRGGSGKTEVVGDSEAVRELLYRVEQVASRDSTVLITGESGVGKELIAKRIHELSPRAAGPFVPINCAAIPESLIESELFGHERGAFTSAIEERAGHFELADSGTLFLDEIGELSLSVQVKMLRFLQEQEFFRVGSSKSRRVNVRVVAATNRKLEDLVREKKFRQDLYYRIHVVNLEVPPLRERYEDIPILVQHFLKSFREAYGEREISFSDEVWTTFREYPWPGNIRELENVIESILALAPEGHITEEHIPARLLNAEITEPVQFRILDKGLNFEEAERQFESEIILKALRKTDFVQTRAADLLGISRRILKYKMDKLGITDELERQKVVEAE